MERWDAIVVGAGPAGAMCALALARAGVRILMVERGAAGRDKPCGEGLMPRGAEVLERVGLADLLGGAPAIRAIALHARGSVAEARFRGEPGRGVRRAALDRAMAERASAAGAVVRFGAAARWIAPEEGGVRVGLDRGVARARVVVGADGARSAVRRWAGLGAGRGPGRVGVVGHARGPWRDRVDLWLERGWQVALTPVDGGAVSVAALVEPGRARELGGGPREWLARRLAEAGVGVGPVEPVRCVPLGGRARAPLAEGVVLVGDAAEAIDPIVGCGIALALESGEAAARAIVEALDGRGPSPVGLAGYARALRRLYRAPAWGAALGVALGRSPALQGPVSAAARRWPGLADRLLHRVGGRRDGPGRR